MTIVTPVANAGDENGPGALGHASAAPTRGQF
jgi:hypothetical protein